MPIIDQLFTRHSRDSRALSLALNQRAQEYFGVHLTAYTEEEKRTKPAVDLVAELVEKAVVVPPVLGAGIRFVGRTSETSRPTGTRGQTGVVHIFTFAVETFGDVNWLRYWPDVVAPQVQPVDAGLTDEDVYTPIEDEKWSAEGALQQWEFRRRVSRWFLCSKDDELELAVRVDVTPEDVKLAAEPSEEIKSRIVLEWISEIRPIIEAIAKQIEDFNQNILPSRYTERVSELQQTLRGIHRISTEVEIPFGQLAQSELSVEPVSKIGSPASLSEVALGNHRLARASFEDVVRTIRVWRSGVERYPRAYAKFTEDMISDTLCVTLNAALPGADREVYRKAGKTDVTVRAEYVDAGLGPELVFVCENKIWGGQSEVAGNVEQLCGYLDARETAAVLLYCVRIRDFDHARQMALAALRKVDGFVREAGYIAQWPLLRLERSGRGIDLLVAFVHTYDQKEQREG